MKHQAIMRHLCWIRCFCCFSVLFIKSASFHTKSMTFHENQQNQINICVYVTCGMHFSYFSVKRTLWHVVSGSVDTGLRSYVRSLHHVLMSWHYAMMSFVMSHGTCARAIKEPGTTSWGDSWSNSRWVRRYTCMHGLTHWHACIERAYFLQI